MKPFIGVLSIRPDIVKRILMESDLRGTPVCVSSYPFPHKEGYPAAAFNDLLEEGEQMGADVSIICHDDIYLPDGWLGKLEEKISELPETWVIAGFFGFDEEGKKCGNIHDMRVPKPWITNHKFPVPATFADGCCHVFNTKKGFRYDDYEIAEWHDTYAFLRAREQGTAWIIDCQIEHYCTRSFSFTPDPVHALPAWEKLKKRFPGNQIRNLCYYD